ncbi:hypothetical protein [Nocardia terpenica]|nr:hypothetical protein [Nocardia terpenica]NQE90349.1 hypothetical protein [Nocardia terpenica]
MTTRKKTDDTKNAARQVNPIVAEAADQVRQAKGRQRKSKGVPRWGCPGQLDLFTREELRNR